MKVAIFAVFGTLATCAIRINDPGLDEQEFDVPINFGHLPPDTKAHIMENEILTAKDRANFVINRETREAFKHQAPQAFARKFGCDSIEKLHQYKKSEDYEFSKVVFSAIPVECISNRINLNARLQEWGKIEFMIKCGADPNLLAYSMRRALAHGWSDDSFILGRLGVPDLPNTPKTAAKLNEMLKGANDNSDMPEVDIFLPPRTIDIASLDKFLWETASVGVSDTVQLLLENGADVFFTGGGYTPLHEASFKGKTVTMEKLISAGANLDATNNLGNTPLFDAALNGKAEAVIELVSAGAKVNIKNYNGDTALHFAAQGGHGDVVDQLLKHGADRNIKNKYGQTALGMARHSRNFAEIRRLLSFSQSTDSHAKDIKMKERLTRWFRRTFQRSG